MNILRPFLYFLISDICISTYFLCIKHLECRCGGLGQWKAIYALNCTYEVTPAIGWCQRQCCCISFSVSWLLCSTSHEGCWSWSSSFNQYKVIQYIVTKNTTTGDYIEVPYFSLLACWSPWHERSLLSQIPTIETGLAVLLSTCSGPSVTIQDWERKLDNLHTSYSILT